MVFLPLGINISAISMEENNIQPKGREEEGEREGMIERLNK